MANGVTILPDGTAVLRIAGEGRPLSVGPIVTLAVLGYLLTGRRALGFGVGAAVGVWLQTSGTLDQLMQAVQPGRAPAAVAAPQGEPRGSYYQGGTVDAGGAGAAF